MIIKTKYEELKNLSIFISANKSFEELSKIIEMADAIVQDASPSETIAIMSIKDDAKKKLEELSKK